MNGNLCFVHDLRGKHSSFIVKYDAISRLLVDAVYQVNSLLSVFYHEWVKYFVKCLICVNNQQIGLFILNCCIYEHKVVRSIFLSLLMAAESVEISRFIPDIADLCHLSLSQALLEVYHSLLMTF